MEISTTGSIDPELEQTLGKFGNAINVRNQSVAAINQSIDYIDRLEDFAHPLRIFILENDFENNLNQEQFMTLKVLIDAAIPFLRSLDNSAAHVFEHLEKLTKANEIITSTAGILDELIILDSKYVDIPEAFDQIIQVQSLVTSISSIYTNMENNYCNIQHHDSEIASMGTHIKPHDEYITRVTCRGSTISIIDLDVENDRKWIRLGNTISEKTNIIDKHNRNANEFGRISTMIRSALVHIKQIYRGEVVSPTRRETYKSFNEDGEFEDEIFEEDEFLD